MARIGKMLLLVMEVAGAKLSRSWTLRSQISYLAAGLWIAAKGTRNEIDARSLIEEIYPEFFEDEEQKPHD